jgi:TRAP-type C4-dicarboxylate transport system permease small subunit
MSVRTARVLTVLFFMAYAVVLTWPGTIPFNRFRPQVLGLPFSFFWVGLWVAMAAVVLFGLHRVETRNRKEG